MSCHVARYFIPKTLFSLVLCLLVNIAFAQDTAQTKPTRIVSMNLCADQLLIMLADRKHILSLSNLAIDKNLSFIADQVGDIPLNEGHAEQVVALQPDLILAGRYSDTSAPHMLSRLGYNIEIINITFSISDIKDNIRAVAKLLQEEQRGEMLIQRMEQRIKQASKQAQQRKRRLALIYAPNGYTSGSKTISHEALDLAGLDNLAALKGIEYYGNLSLESVIEARPELLIINDGTLNPHSLAQRQLQHPALQHWLGDKNVITMPPQLWICGGPMIADAIEFLVAH